MTSQLVDIDGHMIRPEDVSAVTKIWHRTKESSDHFAERIWSGFTVHLASKGEVYVEHTRKSTNYMSESVLKKDFEELDAEVAPLRQMLLDAIEQHPRRHFSLNEILTGEKAA